MNLIKYQVKIDKKKLNKFIKLYFQGSFGFFTIGGVVGGSLEYFGVYGSISEVSI